MPVQFKWNIDIINICWLIKNGVLAESVVFRRGANFRFFFSFPTSDCSFSIRKSSAESPNSLTYFCLMFPYIPPSNVLIIYPRSLWIDIAWKSYFYYNLKYKFIISLKLFGWLKIIRKNHFLVSPFWCMN